MKITTGTRQTFVMFMVRDGFTASQAAAEFDNVLTINGHARIEASYLTVSRVGQPFTLTRAQRRSIYLTFSNAQNHAAFALQA
jgi:hypothetical protein